MASGMEHAQGAGDRRHPNLIGAGLILGLMLGATLGGVTGDFDLWVPVVGLIGLSLGLALHRFTPRKEGEES